MSDQGAPRVTAAIFQHLEPYVNSHGGNFDALLEEAGLSRDDIADPDNLISMNSCAYLMEATARALDDPCFGLHWAEKLPEGSAGIIGYLLVNAKSVRMAVKSLERYASLHIDPIDASFEEEDGVGRLSWRFPVTFTAPRVQFCSFLMAITIIRLRLHAGVNWMPISVELEHRALECTSDADRILGPNVRYDQPCNGLNIREAVLNRSSPHADERLFGLIKSLGDRMMAERKVSTDISQRTSNAIVELLQESEATLEGVAQIMAIPPRSLQSQLAATGTNFETLLHETRQSLAATYLRDTDLPMTEIALLLGFSELSAFTRAANRWFGVPPRQYRYELRNSA